MQSNFHPIAQICDEFKQNVKCGFGNKKLVLNVRFFTIRKKFKQSQINEHLPVN